MNKELLPTQAIENLYSQTIENNSIQNHLDNLHDLMIDWADCEGQFSQKEQDSMFNTYRSLRHLLQELKPLEQEHLNYWKKGAN